jgi:uncharacterized protein YkwD
MKSRSSIFIFTLTLLLIAPLTVQPVLAQDPDPTEQTTALLDDELRTVYLGNLARQEHGVPPLRWNREMTVAARWYSWDSVENRAGGFCGHQDTLGRWPSERLPAFGYRGRCGAENAFCGYVTPEDAIEGWMNSEGHRANLLSAGSWEVGLGYYRRSSDGRGYVTQDFGWDAVYPPVVIENEALQTATPDVALYIYSNEQAAGFAGLGPAAEMRVANDPCFTGAGWEPYAAEKDWTLEPGSGWRSVYVRTRDAVGRTTVVSDTIYLGAEVPREALGFHLASTTSEQVTLWGLDGGAQKLPSVQFSPNWFADDTLDTFTLWWGNGERVNDASAQGGTAFRLRPGDGESFAWVWSTSFVKEVPLVAYFRLKVSDNTSGSEVARISVDGGGTEYGPRSLKGTDFDAANVYQAFPVDFTFHDNPDDVFLTFNIWRSGDADVYVDGITLFTAPQPVQSPLTWTVPGGNYRGGGIWVRYTDGAGTFSPIETADLTPERIAVQPASLPFLVEKGGPAPDSRTLTVVQKGCDPFTWNATDDAAWLSTQQAGQQIQVSVDPQGLDAGRYEAEITVDAGEGVVGSPMHVPVTLFVAEQLHHVHLPLVLKAH